MHALQQWADLEDRAAELEDLRFRQLIGLDVNPAEIEQCAQAVNTLAQVMAPSHRQESDAWSLLSFLIQQAKLAPIETEMRELEEQYLTFDDILLDGKPVTPYLVKQYLYRQDDPHKRHELVSRIAQGHPAVDQAWARHRAMQSELAAQWDYSPLDDLMLAEGLDVTQLRYLLVEMASAMRPAFESRFVENRAAVLGNRQGEPWEDLVTLFANRWSAHVDQFLPAIDSVAAVCQVARKMGFAMDAITMDVQDRPRKMPGASTWCPRIPADVRISVKPVSGADDLNTLYHEMGHALHFSSIDPRLPYARRGAFSFGIAETFSFWMESLVGDPVYLAELGLAQDAVQEATRFAQLVTATFAVWCSANALCIADYWMEGPLTHEQLGERFSHYAEQFMGISFPAQYLPRLVRTIDMNAVGYPIAYARLGHLLNRLEGFQRDWWRVPAAVDFMRSFMRGARQAGFPTSMLDVGPFVRRYGRLK